MRTIADRYEQVRVYVEVAEQASFTRAAERLRCSKAYASTTVAALEAALGVQLLHRTTRRLALTEAGRVYLDYGRQLRDTLQEAEHAVSNVNTQVRGKLRITVPSSFGDVFLVDIARSFQAIYPEVDLEVDLSVLRRDLIGDDYDCAIRAMRSVDAHLVARPLGVAREVLVAAPALVARLPPLTRPADLADAPCLTNVSFRDDPHWVFESAAGSETVTVRGRLGINAYSALKRAALEELGITRLPLYLVREELADGRLQRLLPGYEPVPSPLWLVYAQRRQRPLRARVFIEFLLRWFEHPARRDLFR